MRRAAWLLGVISALAAFDASAAAGDPYQRLHANTGTAGDPEAHCLWWPGSSAVTISPNAQGTPELDGGLAQAAISRSIATWRTQFEACGSLAVSEGTPLPQRTTGYDVDAGAVNVNLVVFRAQGACNLVVAASDPCWSADRYGSVCANTYDCWPHGRAAIAITTNTYEISSGRVYDADVELNDNGFRFTATEATSPACVPPDYTDCVFYDVENTMTHELGHVFGLDHDPDPASTMYASAPQGETQKRSLDPGTLQFVCDVYPAGSYAHDCIRQRLQPDLGPASCSSLGSAGPPALLAFGVVFGMLLRRRRR